MKRTENGKEIGSERDHTLNIKKIPHCKHKAKFFIVWEMESY